MIADGGVIANGIVFAAFALSILGLCISWGRYKTNEKEQP